MARTNPQADQPRSLVPLARAQRAAATDAERALWRLLRSRHLAGVKFRRQRPFGPYILDFYCLDKRLAVEADGSQHLSEEGIEADRVRTGYLERHGVRVLRFTNRDILTEREGVLGVILQALGIAGAGASPSP